ncbi:unnamed protein product [Mucor hiemalis]
MESSCEVGISGVTVVDDKYLNDGFVKLPKTLKGMLEAQVEINPAKANDLCAVGYLMMGIDMELVIADMPFGNLVARITRSSRFPFPLNADNFAADLLSLLEMAYVGKSIMESNIKVINDRGRRKLVEDGESDENDDALFSL